MERILKIGLWLIGLWVANTASSIELDEGLKAYNAGDYETALKVFKPLAEQGIARAQFILGLMVDRGKGVSKDRREAAKWYELAAEQGFADGQFNLGSMYENGKGVRQDYGEAAKWYQLAAEQGSVYSQVSLGYLYSFGEGVRKDRVYALMWFNLATFQGYKEAAEAKKTISNIMTPSQIEKAQELARQCVIKNYKDC